MKTLQCVYCKHDFTAKRSDAKTCSDRCRKELSRTRRRVRDLFKQIRRELRADYGSIGYLEDIGTVAADETNNLLSILETLPVTVTPAEVTLKREA